MDRIWDVIVVGGGFAGTAAALSAARGGAKTLLIEQGGFLGGAAGRNLILPFMPNETQIQGDKDITWLSRGIYLEVRKKLTAIGAAEGPYFHEEYLKLLLDRLTAEAGAEVLFHSTLIGAEVENGAIASVTVMAKANKITLRAKQYIDATGDADLSVMAGCPYHTGRSDGLCQPMTLCFRTANVDVPKFLEACNSGKVNLLYRKMQAEGKIKNPREDILFFRTMIPNCIHFNTTRVVKLNPTDPFDLSKAEREGREQMFEMFSFLKENVPGFENSQLMTSAAEIGVRESRMIDGEYLLTQEDLLGFRKFSDAIAAGNYDIDIHNPEGSGTSHFYFPQGEWYTIPFRALLPRKIGNLLTAGRCASGTHEAQASFRIMPIVCCLGEAAGTAAAMAVNMDTPLRNLEICALQKTLTDNGAFTGLTQNT